MRLPVIHPRRILACAALLGVFASSAASSAVVTKYFGGTLACDTGCTPASAATAYLAGVAFTGSYSYDDAVAPTSGDPATFRDYSGGATIAMNIGSGLYTVSLTAAGIEIQRNHSNPGISTQDEVFFFGGTTVFGGSGTFTPSAPSLPASFVHYVDHTATVVLPDTLIANWPQTIAAWSNGAGSFAGVEFFILDASSNLIGFRGAFTTLSDTAPQAFADLSITKTDGVTTASPGGTTTYTIIASNAGPVAAPGTTVADTLPAVLSGATWTCAGSGGGTCTAAGSGNINDIVNLPAGGSVTYTVTANIDPAATGTLSNTATVEADSRIDDPNPGNNSATDTDTLVAQADLGVSIADAPDPATAGNTITYTITTTNAGPSDAAAVTISFPLGANTTFVSVSAPAGTTCTSPAVGAAGTVSCTVTGTVAPAGIVVLSVVVNVNPAFAGTVTATATAASAAADPTPGNNSATAATAVNALTFVVTGVAPFGGGTINCASPVQFGTATTCVVTPEPGRLIGSISGCGGIPGTSSPYTTGPITAGCTVTVIFVVAPIPTLQSAALAVLALLLVIAGGLRLNRRC